MPLSFGEITEKIKARFGVEITDVRDNNVVQPWVEVKPSGLARICRFLKDDSELDLNFCDSISGVDDTKLLWVVYHLYSLRKKHEFILKVKLEKENPSIQSVSDVWRTADWQEREIYDMYGITFEGHPDMRRILLPEDWKGHPLRKDYTFPEDYDGIPLR